MTICRGKGKQGQEGDGGIDIEPEIEGRGREGFFTEGGIREASREGGGAIEIDSNLHGKLLMSSLFCRAI